MAKNVVVIGALALGPKAACRLKRLEPEANVTMIDQSDRISFGGCGIPYYVSGEVSNVDELRATPYHMIRDDKFFAQVKGVNTLVESRVVKIDREGKTVEVENVRTGEHSTLPYDKLVIGTGKSPRRLPIEGSNLGGVHTVTDLDEAEAIRNAVSTGKVNKAVVIGAGFIGLEMAVAFADMWGIDTEVVEFMDTILPGFVSRDMARMGQNHMEENGVSFRLGEKVERLEGKDGRVSKIITDKGEIEADLVIMSVGVSPNDQLARDCGLDCHERGGIIVDEYMRTSDPDIYAGGDCAIIRHQVTGQPFFLPMGSMANRQGRVIGSNLAGGSDTFDGAVGTFCVKLFDFAIAGAGLSIGAAQRAGLDAVNVHVEQMDRAHFYPEKSVMGLELVVEKETGRVLGIQGIGTMGDAVVGRINAVAALLPHKPHVSDISNLEVAYSPPFASAMDIVNALGNVAENVLAGRNRTLDIDGFDALWRDRENGKCVFLDTRAERDAEPFLEKHPGHWVNIPQDEIRARCEEIPSGKPLVLVCNTGLRSYEAQLVLDELGITDTHSVAGGMAAIKKWGSDV